MKYPLTEQLVITSVTKFNEKKALFVDGNKNLKRASSKTATAILEAPSLQLECLRKSKSGRQISLYNSAFSPTDPEVIRDAGKALRGELEHVRLFRVILRKHSLLFEFYNERSGLLSSLQSENPISFVIRRNGNIYYVRYGWVWQESQVATTVRIRKDVRQGSLRELWRSALRKLGKLAEEIIAAYGSTSEEPATLEVKSEEPVAITLQKPLGVSLA